MIIKCLNTITTFANNSTANILLLIKRNLNNEIKAAATTLGLLQLLYPGQGSKGSFFFFLQKWQVKLFNIK